MKRVASCRVCLALMLLSAMLSGCSSHWKYFTKLGAYEGCMAEHDNIRQCQRFAREWQDIHDGFGFPALAPLNYDRVFDRCMDRGDKKEYQCRNEALAWADEAGIGSYGSGGTDYAAAREKSRRAAYDDCLSSAKLPLWCSPN